MNLDKFLNETLTPRTESVEVKQLAEFFEKGEEPVWVVRGLTAHEVGRAKQASERGQDDLKALIKALAGDGDQAEAMRSYLGLSEEEVPQDISYRIEILAAASVDPPIGQANRDIAVKLAENFPQVFFLLTNKITNLTGLGAEVGKRKPSGKTTKSDK